MTEAERQAIVRLAEFSRQARMNRDVDHASVYRVWTDVDAEPAPLSLDDIDAVLSLLGHLRLQGHL